MAENADIKLLEEALQKYGYEPGTVDGQWSVPGETNPDQLFNQVRNLLNLLRNIDGVTQELGVEDIAPNDPYTTAQRDAIAKYFTNGKDNLHTILIEGEKVSFFGFGTTDKNDIVQALKDTGYASHKLIAEPELLYEFVDTDMDAVLTALDNLQTAGELDTAPSIRITAEEQTRLPELRIESIENLEGFLKRSLYSAEQSFYHGQKNEEGKGTDGINALEAKITALETELAAEEDVSKKTAITKQITEIQKNIDELTELSEEYKAAREALESSDAARDRPAGSEWPETSQNALNAYTEFMQANENIGWDRRQDGVYSNVFKEQILRRVDELNETIGEIAITAETPQEVIQQRNNIISMRDDFNIFVILMQDMHKYGVVELGEDQPSDFRETKSGLDTISDYDARTIVNAGIQSLHEGGLLLWETNTDLDSESYDLNTRRATQILIAEIAHDLDISTSSGRYSDLMRNKLETALKDETTRQDIAEKYFQGDIAHVERLVLALNTLSTIPDISGKTSNIASDKLIYSPNLGEAEQNAVKAYIKNTPANELAAVNHMATIMTGVGFERMLPDRWISRNDYIAQSLTASDHQTAFTQMFETMLQDAQAAVGPTDPAALQAHILKSIDTQISDAFEDIGAFGDDHIAHLTIEMKEAAITALKKHTETVGTDAEKSAAAAAHFAAEIPEHTAFTDQYGVNQRRDVMFNFDDMQGLLPEAMEGFGGSIPQIEDVSLRQAMRGQTVNEMLAQIQGSYDNGIHSVDNINPSTILRRIGESSAGLNQSEQAQDTLQDAITAMASLRATLTTAYEQSGETGPLVIESGNKETFLLTRNDAGEIDIRYLDAAGIEYLDEDIPEHNISAHTNMEETLIKTAYATYQARNGAQSDDLSVHQPSFFQMGDKLYVGGLDDTLTFQIVEVNTEVYTQERAIEISKTVTPEAFQEAQDALADDDPAYDFIRENYGGYLERHGGYKDYMFEKVARAIDTDEATAARTLINTRYEVDNHEVSAQDITEPYTGLSSTLSIVLADRIRNGQGNEEFIVLDEDDTGTPHILLVQPNGEGEAPGIVDISNPSVYQRMRDSIKDLDVIPFDSGSPLFQDFQEWKEAGAPPSSLGHAKESQRANLGTLEAQPPHLQGAWNDAAPDAQKIVDNIGPKHYTNIHFVFDEQYDVEGALAPGIYIDIKDDPQLHDISMAPADIAKWEARLGIPSLESLYHEAFPKPEENAYYEQQTSRFFIVAIPPNCGHEEGFMLGYADDSGNPKFTFLPSDEYITSLIGFDKKLSASYMTQDANGHDRFLQFPRDAQHGTINPYTIKGAVVGPDGHLGPIIERLDMISHDIHSNGWDGSGPYKPGETNTLSGALDELRKAAASLTQPPTDIPVDDGSFTLKESPLAQRV